ncbi:fluoride efflux transporter CrcB [Ferroacidibacillus organovorans]|uniref:Fluoride-specific ion channel FluC n=1 Tax=Ferroacidibacillus organovorans TaxID=1765683 RepID=A0A1V4EWW3_9BACL|nr:fluoride efflux transporter CrcB [Ferroacidibacillus organovorans]OPG17426.1 hypothetical protein B2M26_01450 [Ferroacidibacillus organovorans]
MIEWVGVAIGGMFGACTRFFITNQINARFKKSFPVATFLINITGAFLLGYVYAAARPNNLVDYWLRSAIGIGFIGAYTTFSTWMFESATLRDRRAVKTMVAYLLASLVVGLFGAWVGSRL